MNTLAFAVFAALYTHTVYCSYYHGPTAKPVVLHNGYLADTHEVAAAKNAHLAALAKESHYDYGYSGNYAYGHGQEYSGDHHGDNRYHRPTAIPYVLHDGHIVDTHEVAAAKAEHFAAVAKAKAHGGYGDHSARYASDYSANHADHGNDHRYEGSYGEDHTSSHGDIRYHGPTAIPHVLHDGHIADTQEVAAAKDAHLAAEGKHHSHGNGHGYEGSYGEDHTNSHGDIRYYGPTAIPHVLHDGHIADTHEVAAAKAEHLAEVAKTKAHEGYGDHYNGNYASESDVKHEQTHHVAPYHGPLAKPVVLKSGYLADTHEVAAAKQHHQEALHGDSSHRQYDYHYKIFKSYDNKLQY